MDTVRFGDGSEPLIILPGLTIKDAFASPGALAMSYKAFREDFDVTIIGRRRTLPDGYGIRQMAADTMRIIDALGIGEFKVLGISQGGMIAQVMALTDPQRVRRMALACTFARENEHFITLNRRWVAMARVGEYDEVLTDFFAHVYTERYRKKYGKLLMMNRGNITDEEADRFIRLAQACRGFSIYDELPDIKVPALVISAEDDQVVTARGSCEIAEQLQNAQLMMLGSEYGHAACDEDRSLKKKICEYLKRED